MEASKDKMPDDFVPTHKNAIPTNYKNHLNNEPVMTSDKLGHDLGEQDQDKNSNHGGRFRDEKPNEEEVVVPSPLSKGSISK